MLINLEHNRTEEIGLVHVTPTPEWPQPIVLVLFDYFFFILFVG